MFSLRGRLLYFLDFLNVVFCVRNRELFSLIFYGLCKLSFGQVNHLDVEFIMFSNGIKIKIMNVMKYL